MNTRFVSDKLAISLSLMCVVHCFFVPSFLILSSSFISFSFDNESIHKLILITAIPISLFALISGFLNHKNHFLLFAGMTGLFLLFLAVALGESFLGETGERTLTLVGSFVVAFSHYKNYKICEHINCQCHEE
jgi:hypothetical protein|tara:strand:- start:577 stop:975 length:399 start_codon:yes stop_codon:yes gene_type:complete